MSHSQFASSPAPQNDRLPWERRRTAASLLAAGGIALLVAATGPAAAQAPCAQWEVHGRWVAIQGTYSVSFHLEQRGTTVHGIGAYSTPGSLGRFDGWSAAMPVTGTARGNAVELQTAWGGVYVGTVDGTGRIDGFTYDRRDSTSSARWFSDRRMKCAVQAGSPAPAPAATSPRPAPIQQVSDTVAPARKYGAASAFRNGWAQIPASVPTPAFAPGRPGACKPGFVPRLARAADLVCVTPRSRDRIARENATARERVQPGDGAYGPNTCRAKYVWREAFPGDGVCVRPGVRELVREENRLAPTRVN
jgi:hypothetical protein